MTWILILSILLSIVFCQSTNSSVSTSTLPTTSTALSTTVATTGSVAATTVALTTSALTAVTDASTTNQNTKLTTTGPSLVSTTEQVSGTTGQVSGTTTNVTATPVCDPNSPTACNDNGVCANLNGTLPTCHCDPRYLGNECEVHQKSRLTAFLLEFFLGFWGAGNFYLSRWAAAVINLILGILLCCASGGAKKSENGKVGGVACVLSLALFIWWVVDLVLIATGEYTANGYPTYPDM